MAVHDAEMAAAPPYEIARISALRGLPAAWPHRTGSRGHRTPIKRGGDPYPELAQLASLCESCHNQKTRAEQLGEDWLRKGCDVFGCPLDPDHPWNKERSRK